MERTVVLLGGVNVGGRRLSMALLRAGLVDTGCTDVTTYILSGNVVLTMPGTRPADRDAWLSSVIGTVAGFDVPVVTRSADELDAVVAGNPYPTAGGAQLHVVFHREPPDVAMLSIVAVSDFGPEECTLVGSELYLHLPNGIGRARLPVALTQAGRRVGAPPGTARNWNTVLKLQALARA